MPKILVIERETELRRVFRRDLELDGYAVVATTTGTQGLDLMDDASPDLVLFDAGPTEYPGLEHLRQFLDRCPRVPVVAVVAREHAAVSPLCQAADAYVTRSPDTRALRDTIRGFFGAEPA